MDFLDLCKKRYSERRFSDKTIENKNLDKILEAARISPSAHNFQPWKFLVIKSEEGLKKIRSLTKMTFNAPIVIIVCYDINEARKSSKDTYFKDYNSGNYDCGIAVSMMAMEAASLGIKSCIVRDYDTQDIIDAFDISDNIKVAGILDLGYESENSKPSPQHEKRKSIEEIAKFL